MTPARIPTQEQVDWDDPVERVVWALIHLPNVGGAAMAAHPDVIRSWAQHLDDLGFVHVDRLKQLADADGLIRVDQLPEQKTKYQTPYRGPQHAYNTSGKWVPIDTPEPKKVVVQDLSKSTREELEAYRWQLEQLGMLEQPKPAVDLAAVEE